MDCDDPSPPGAQPPMDARGLARRRFTRTGLGAAGVLMTLASTPGMATDVCTSPSGSLSGGLQSHHGNAVACAGLSSGYWKNHADWPAGCQPNTPFGQVFTVDAAHASTYGAVSCGDILSHQPFDESNLGMHLVAAWLNALAGLTSFLTTDDLRRIWNEWQAKGYYNPVPSVRWNAASIVIYLSGTMQ